MNILGISAYHHDSAAALLIDGKIIAAAQEERFTRKKHTAEFPANAVKYCLDFSGYKIDDLFPMSSLSKLFNKDPLMLSGEYSTYFIVINKNIDKNSFEKF
jgi:carbamoyltransferase